MTATHTPSRRPTKRRYYNYAVLVELVELNYADRKRRRVWRGYRAYNENEALEKADKPLDVWRVVKAFDRPLSDEEYDNFITNTRAERANYDRRK